MRQSEHALTVSRADDAGRCRRARRPPARRACHRSPTPGRSSSPARCRRRTGRRSRRCAGSERATPGRRRTELRLDPRAGRRGAGTGSAPRTCSPARSSSSAAPRPRSATGASPRSSAGRRAPSSSGSVRRLAATGAVAVELERPLVDRAADADRAKAARATVPAARGDIRRRALRRPRPDALRDRFVRPHVRDDVRRRRARPDRRRARAAVCAAHAAAVSPASSISGRFRSLPASPPPSSACSTASSSVRRASCPASGSSPVDRPLPLLAVAVAVGALLLANSYAIGTLNRWREEGAAAALVAPSGIAGTCVFLGFGVVAAGWYLQSSVVEIAGGAVVARRRRAARDRHTSSRPVTARSPASRRRSASSTPSSGSERARSRSRGSPPSA